MGLGLSPARRFFAVIWTGPSTVPMGIWPTKGHEDARGARTLRAAFTLV